MKFEPRPPQSARAKIVYLIWNNMPRSALLVMVALILVLGAVIKKESDTIAADKAAAMNNEKPPVNGVTLTLSPTSIHDRLNLPGLIEPWTHLRLLAKINGTITEVLVQEGDYVKEGDIIAKIESDDYRIALDRARAAFNLAKANFERDKTIFQKGGLAAAAMDAKETQLQTAKADLENAELQFSRCTITAPMDGIIRSLDAEVGLLLSVADPIAEILEIDRLKGVVGIPESDVNAVRQLDMVELTIQALDDEKIQAKKHFLSPSPETVARLYNLELEIGNQDGRILPGMFIRADVVKRTVDDVIAVPFYSVISRNDEQFVFVEQDGLAHKRFVSLGIMEGWMVEITEGLQSGDRLLVEGHRDVEDNQKVNVVKVLTDTGELML